MDEKQARKILGRHIKEENDLGPSYAKGSMGYLSWEPEDDITLDGSYSPEQLKAIVWWMENMEKSVGSWTKIEDGEYNEQSLVTPDGKLTIFSDREGEVWHCRVNEDEDAQSLDAKDETSARREARDLI